MFTIQITERELALLQAGLKARHKRCSDRIKYLSNRKQNGKNTFVEPRSIPTKISEIDSLYTKLSQCSIS